MPPVTRSSSKGNKSLSAHCYRDQFRAHLTKVKASDSCTSSNAQFDDTGKRQKKNGNTSLEPCSPGVIKDVEEELVSGPELSPKSGCSTTSLKINAANSLDKLYAEQKGLHHMCLRSEGAKLQSFSKDLATGIEGFNLSNRKRKLIHEGFDIGGGKKKLNYVNKTKTSIEKILARQTSEAKELQTLCDESKAKLEKYFKLECLEVNRSINSTEAVCTDKLKILEANHMKKLEELESEMGSCLRSMEAKHKNERKTMEKKVNCKMNERKSLEDYGLLDDLLTKAAEVIPAKSFTSSKNDLEEEDSQERGSVGVDVSLLHGPEEPHNDTAEDSSRAEVAENNADRKMDINSNDGDISKSPEENGLLDNLPTKAAEVIPAKGFTSLGNDLEEEDSEEHGSVGAHVPLLHGAEEPHNDAVENSSSAEPAENFADNHCSKNPA